MLRAQTNDFQLKFVTQAEIHQLKSKTWNTYKEQNMGLFFLLNIPNYLILTI